MSRQSSQTSPRRVRCDRGVYYRPLPNGGRRYEVTYTDDDCKQRWEVVDGGIAEARARRAELVGKKSRNEPVRRTHQTLAEYAREWIDREERRRRLAANTRRSYKGALDNHILPALGRKKLQSLRVDDVARLVAELEEKLDGTSVGVYLTPLALVCDKAVRDGLLPSNPVRGLTRDERPKRSKKEQRALDTDEVRRLVEATPEPYRLLVELSIATGLRKSEALGLVFSDLRLDEGKLDVRRQLGTCRQRVPLKTPASYSTVPLPPSIVAKLRAHRQEALALGQAQPEAFVFRSPTGGPMTERTVTVRGLDVAIERTGMNDDPDKPKLTWHGLRHTCGSLLLSRGASLPYVSKVLRHGDPSITARIYAHVLDERQQDERAGEILDDVLAGKNMEKSGGERQRTQPAEERGIVALFR